MNNNNLTKEQRYDRAMEKNRERQQAYYKENRDKILARKKAKREERLGIERVVEPVVEAVIQPAPPSKQANNKKQVLLLDNVEDILKANQSTFITYRTHIRRLAKVIKGEVDFVKIINQPKKTIPLIEKAVQENGKEYGLSSKLGMFQIIMKLIDEYKIPATESTRKQYLNAFQIYDYNSRNQEKQKTTDIDYAIPTGEHYLNKTKDVYGVGSKQYALVALYTLNEPVRDNFSSIILTSAKKTTEDLTKNYIYTPRSKNQPVEVIINKHKTSNGKGSLKSVLSLELSTIIRNYINNNNIENGAFLFGVSKLSGYISDITKTLYPTIPAGSRGASLFRHMAVSKSLLNGETIEQRQELANKMGSSLRLQNEVYNRPVMAGKKKSKK